LNKKRIQQASNIFINLFYLPLVFISLLGSIGLILVTFSGLRPKSMWFVVLILIISLVVGCVPQLRQWLRDISELLYQRLLAHKHIVLIFLAVITVIWQIVIVYSLSGKSVWDPGDVLTVAVGGQETMSHYFSNYPNTLMLLYMEHGIWNFLGQPTTKVLVFALNYINILIVDVAAILIVSIVRQWFGKKYMKLVILLTWSLFLITPWVALPYTDTWAFFLTALNLWLTMKYELVEKNWQRNLCAICLGLSFTMSYLIKPSLLVVFVALFIIQILRGFSGAIKRRKMVLMMLPVLLGLIAASGVFVGFKAHTARQTLMTVDSKLALPPSHFIAMGMTGIGGYNADDVQLNRNIKSPQKRQAANIKLIQQRLAGFGPTNYFKFLLTKQVANTADGSFSWGNDGIFIIPYSSKNPNMLNAVPRQLFTENGVATTNAFEYRLVVQLIWTVVLFFLLFAGRLKTWRSQLLKYSVVGAMAFLLIFEGGRSRYIIQFLPVFLILSTVSGKGLFEWGQRALTINKSN